MIKRLVIVLILGILVLGGIIGVASCKKSSSSKTTSTGSSTPSTTGMVIIVGEGS